MEDAVGWGEDEEGVLFGGGDLVWVVDEGDVGKREW